MDTIIQLLAQELNQPAQYVENVARLLDEGNTIPFIARYRKELHGAMDDTTLRNLEERLQYLRGLQERRETVKNAIAEQGKLTEELAAAIDGAATLAEVEDLYRPYKQKRRTRASAAREKGLQRLHMRLKLLCVGQQHDKLRACQPPDRFGQVSFEACAEKLCHHLLSFSLRPSAPMPAGERPFGLCSLAFVIIA